MGRVKTTLIKRAGRKIYRKYADRFTTDFEKNKPIVQDILEVKNKKTRNLVVGYVTRLAKMNQQNEQ